MVKSLSTSAFNHLRRISNEAGLNCTDEEVYEMGARLLELCDAAAPAIVGGRRELRPDLTEFEVKALEFIRTRLAGGEDFPSVREITRALGYRSSRSGLLILQHLISKRALIRKGKDIRLGRDASE